MRRWLLLPLLAALFGPVLTPAPALADEGWTITSFHSDITIATDATLTIVENIQVNFAQAHHGIFRTIPIRYRYDDQHDRYYELTVRSVTDGSGQSVPYTTSVENDNEVIKIGDPNVLVSGDQRYVITYTVVGAMNSFSDHDELYWNVDGALWPVSKSAVTANVGFPAGAFKKSACYEGAQGSTETCTQENTDRTAKFASTRGLDAGEQMTVVVGLNKGAVSVPAPLLESKKRLFPQDAFDVTPLTVGGAIAVLLIGIGLIVRFWLLHGRDRAYLTRYYSTPTDAADHLEPVFQHEPIVVEFEPPQGLKPAQLGLILDESADTKDVTATIVDLAVRGYLTITDVPQLLGRHDWLLRRKPGDVPDMLPYERSIFYGLFSNGRQEVPVSKLKGTFQSTLQSAEREIYSDAMDHKFFRTRPDLVRAATIAVAIAVGLAGAGLTWVLGVTFGSGLIGLAVIAVGIVLFAAHRAMSTRTAAGREVMQKALGFRLYMTTAEKYRQQFAEKAEIFTQLLPYAIVFGCVQRWAKAFEGIDTSATNNWYVGTTPFQAAALSSNLESMNSGLASAISASPPNTGSGSGFGGGGSAGGGGGGGGGGAW